MTPDEFDQRFPKPGSREYGRAAPAKRPRCDIGLVGLHDGGKLANIGKNYWTFEPGLNASWLSTKIGTEVSLFAGYDVSTKDGQTDYQSGDVFHLDATLAQHLPLLGGSVGVGANAFAASDRMSSALLLDLSPGVYSFVASGKAGGAGIVLVEVYDMDP